MFEFRLPGGPAHAWSGEVLSIGRDPSNHWVLSSSGVWSRHAEVRRDPTGRLTLRPVGEAVVSVNGLPVREAVLRWGDTVAFGATVVRFHLASPVQRGLRGWERCLWMILLLSLLGQAWLVLALRR